MERIQVSKVSNKIRITIVGCGIVGACLAYELSDLKNVEITVVEARSLPGEGASGAALGICMGVISHKIKGRNWRLREDSLRRYDLLVKELGTEELGVEELGEDSIPYNRQGIVKLCGVEESWEGWQSLQAKRQQQGYRLDLWDLTQAQACFPSINFNTIQGAIYSPHDRQIDPTKLMQRLVQVSQQRGVRFLFNTAVKCLTPEDCQGTSRITSVQLLNHELLNHEFLNHEKGKSVPEGDRLESDYVILTAGVGNNAIAAPMRGKASHVPRFQAVLGQAWEVLLPESLWAGTLDAAGFHPVLTVRDIHFAPLRHTSGYWVGATVEFPTDPEQINSPPSDTIATQLWHEAMEICPSLAQGKIQRHWWGLRPRPVNQAAPVLQWSSTVENLLWATGHYRNGIFLAPATALWVKQQILERF